MAPEKSRLRSFPGHHTVLDYLKTNDHLATIVRGHQCLEIILEHLITESLPFRHEKVTERLPFNFKVDLAIALGAIDPNHRSTLLYINKIRNRFAHNLEAHITEADSNDLFNNIAQPLKHLLVGRIGTVVTNPVNCVVNVIYLAYAFLEIELGKITRARVYNKAAAQILNEKCDEVLGDGSKSRQAIEKSEAEIRERVAKLDQSESPGRENK